MSRRFFGWMEVGKFGVYLVFPVLAVAFITDPWNMKWLLEKRQYVVFPPAQEKPPTTKEDIRKYIQDKEEENRKRSQE